MNDFNIDYNENFNLDSDQIYFDYDEHVLKLKHIDDVECNEHILFKNDDDVALVCSTLSTLKNSEQIFNRCFELYDDLI